MTEEQPTLDGLDDTEPAAPPLLAEVPFALAAEPARRTPVQRALRPFPRCTDSPACARRGCHDCRRSYGPRTP